MDSGERVMNPVAMIITSPRKEYWRSWVSHLQPPFLKSATVLTEPWGRSYRENFLNFHIMPPLSRIALPEGSHILHRDASLKNSCQKKKVRD